MRKIAAVLVVTVVLAALALLVRATPARTATTLLYSLPDANTTGLDNDQFGSAVAVGAGLIVVGAPLQDASLSITRSGVAHVFDARSGQALFTLQKAIPQVDDELGSAVAVVVAAGKTAVAVGVPGDNGGAQNRTDYGAVVLFDAASGAPGRTLVAPVQNQSAHFGAALAVVGPSLLAVGAPDDQAGGMAGGVVYLFDLTSNAPPQVLTEPTPADNDEFGMALAPFGGQLLVGAPGAIGARKFGAAYLFTPGSGDSPVTFTNPDGSKGSQFGAAVAAVGGNVLVGAPEDRTGTGSAWLFQIDGTKLQDLCSVAGAAATNNCGTAVAGRGQDALVGAPGTPVSAKNDAGVVYVFSGGSTSTITDPSPASKGDRFGQAIAALGSFIAIGAPDRAVGPLTDAGIVYVYGAPLPPGTCSQDADCPQGQTCTAAGLCVTPPPPPPGGGIDCRITGCNDGDLCTVDTCESNGQCSYLVKQGVDAVDCRVARIAALLAPNIGAFRGPLVVRVKNLVGHAQAQLSAVESAPSKRAQRRRLSALDHTLATFLQSIKRARKHERIDQSLAGQFVVLAQDALAQIPVARRSLR